MYGKFPVRSLYITPVCLSANAPKQNMLLAGDVSSSSMMLVFGGWELLCPEAVELMVYEVLSLVNWVLAFVLAVAMLSAGIWRYGYLQALDQLGQQEQWEHPLEPGRGRHDLREW